MPWVGQTSFLRGKTIPCSICETPCQCPGSGKPHFYIAPTPQKGDYYVGVSMPWVGQTSFLLAERGKMLITNNMCVNALGRANLISTAQTKNPLGKGFCCVNALGRANLISTLPVRSEFGTSSMCQCPGSGKPHFYGARMM